MSPFTVATIIVPRLFPCVPVLARCPFITANAAAAASALMSSWGRYTFFASNPFPTTSSAGISSPSIMASGSAVLISSFVYAAASFFSPRIIACFRGDSSGCTPFPDTGTPLPSVPVCFVPAEDRPADDRHTGSEASVPPDAAAASAAICRSAESCLSDAAVAAYFSANEIYPAH